MAEKLWPPEKYLTVGFQLTAQPTRAPSESELTEARRWPVEVYTPRR